ncbi:MAG: DEAD/DEAH box helicase, partial [Rhodobacter sp.]|nr:DEAD/DEAH box helicase [Rhodobacter sp.]
TPFTRQTLFFSATMAPEIERITNTFLTNPAKIEVARQATASQTIEQRLFQFTPSRKDRSFAEKRATLRALIRAEGEACTNAIIFCNRKMDVDVVAKSLKQHGFNAAPIHGDLDQSVRTRTLDGFRDGTLRLLVASDVAARGLDIPAVSHVFNFDVPSHPEDYVHRIGRTGRAGRLGKAFTIATPSDDKYLAAIETLVKMPIPRAGAPAIGISDTAEPDARRPPARERGPKRGDRNRPVRDHGREAPREPIRNVPPAEAEAPVPPGAAPAEAVPQPREDRPRDERPPRQADRREPRPERNPRDARPNRDQRREPVRRDDSTVIGMGDHMPDFLTRSFARAGLSGE